MSFHDSEYSGDGISVLCITIVVATVCNFYASYFGKPCVSGHHPLSSALELSIDKPRVNDNEPRMARHSGGLSHAGLVAQTTK
jgi:hypothetical protein